MTENPTSKQEKMIEDIRTLSKLKKEQNYTAIKDIKKLFKLEEETKAIKDRILRGIKYHLGHETEEVNYYKPVSKFLSNNYIEYESNGNRSKALSVEECLNRIRSYLKVIINNLKKSDT